MKTRKVEKDSGCGWEKITQKGPIEIWKTPTMYLTCYHYLLIFRFTHTLEEAKKEALKLYDSYGQN